MTLASTPTSRWAVSARINGEVLTAEVARPGLELVVLGVPGGFNSLELEGWLHDLAGVAIETSRGDSRSRSIPALLHHSLTGLLFSHAQLWDRLDAPRPCSCAFVETPDGASFGWVGEARVHVLVDGDPVEPLWVRVRDEEGREARAAVFAPGREVVVSLQYCPGEEPGAPLAAAIEAQWPVVEAGEVVDAHVAVPELEPPVAVDYAEAVSYEPAQPEPGEWAGPPGAFVTDVAAPPLPESLPQQQPGLAVSPAERVSEESAPVPFEPATPGPEPAEPVAYVATESPQVPLARAPQAQPEETPAPPEAASVPVEGPPQRPVHPVARWLSRLVRWGDREPRRSEPDLVPPADGAPVSAYDALLSDAVPPTPVEAAPIEQTVFDLAAVPAEAPAQAPFESASEVPAAAAPEPPATPAPGMLRPAGLAEILGAPLAPPPSPPSRPAHELSELENVERLSAFLREIEAAEVSGLPVLSPDVPARAADEPIEVDHEPVGADESFGIPPLPEPPAPAAGSAEREDVLEIPQLPPRVAPAEPVARPLEIERVTARASEPPRPAPLPAAAIVAQPPQPPPTTPPAPIALDPAFGFAPPTLAVPARVSEPAESRPGPVTVEAPPMLKVSLPALAEPEPVAAEEEPLVVTLPPPAPRAPRAFEVEPAPRRGWSFGSTRGADGAPLPWFRRPPVWAAAVIGVFVVGWLVGSLASPGADRGGPVMAALRAIGIGAAHFTANINSRPGGAQIEIDGKPQGTRTPATLELPPGEHTVKLLMPGLGAVTVPLKAKNGEKVTVDESLHGSLEVLDPEASVPISVTVDGKAVGYAPLKLDDIEPGLHEVHFTGPGMPAFAQTVEVSVRGTAQIVARPMSAPANGVIQAQATLNDERGASPLSGAQVYVDGTLRGVTPLTVDLPRGPHSLRVTWRGETAPVQVIDLPGGNQRFASFNFGLDTPEISVTPVGPSRTFSPGQPKIVSATLRGLSPGDVGEAWLRARSSEGLWRRFPMTLVRGAGEPVVTGVFPDDVFDARNTTRWYVSIVTPQGDEYFSEMQESSLAPAPRASAPRPTP